MGDIDQQIGLAHPEPQMVDEVRPSGEEHPCAGYVGHLSEKLVAF